MEAVKVYRRMEAGEPFHIHDVEQLPPEEHEKLTLYEIVTKTTSTLCGNCDFEATFGIV